MKKLNLQQILKEGTDDKTGEYRPDRNTVNDREEREYERQMARSKIRPPQQDLNANSPLVILNKINGKLADAQMLFDTLEEIPQELQSIDSSLTNLRGQVVDLIANLKLR